MSTSISPVAREIANQIGAGAFVMMGTFQRIADGDDLTFDIRGSDKFNWARIHLTKMDTYTLTLTKIEMDGRVEREEMVEGLYHDTLRAAIEYHTGLTLTVPRVRGINA